MNILDKKLDKLWSSKILGNGRCERCGSKNNLSAHHIIGRTSRKLRWELENGVCLCFSCHRLAHDNPEEFKKWLRKNRDYDKLVQIGSQICKLSDKDKQNLLKKYG